MSPSTYRITSYLSEQLYFVRLLQMPKLRKSETLLFELYIRPFACASVEDVLIVLKFESSIIFEVVHICSEVPAKVSV